MARYGVTTKMSSEVLIEKAVAFFGEQGAGRDVVSQGGCCATFEGGGGHVSVTVTGGEASETEVELVTREWDYEVKRFMREIA